MTDTHDATEVITPEVMPPAGTDLAITTPVPTDALEAAAAHAMAEPSVAGRDEFLSLCLQARMLSMSDLAPEAIRGKPYDALLILMTARDLGIPPTAAMRKVSVIGGQPALDTQLLCALVRRQGLGAVVPTQRHAEQEHITFGEAVAMSPDGVPMGPPIQFTWSDAQEAGYADPTCMPGAHNLRTINIPKRDGGTWQKHNTCDCKDGYRKHPLDMLYWRAAARVCRFYFPEAGLGLYSPEEISNFTDAEGRPFDPASVELPEGYTDPEAEKRRKQAERDAPAEPADLWELQESINALPDGIQAELREAWMRPESRVRGVPARMIPARLLRPARAMVNAHWGKARQAGIDRDEQIADLRQRLGAAAYHAVWLCLTGSWGPAPASEAAASTASGTQEAPEASPAADTAPEPSEAASGDTSAASEPVETDDERKARKAAERQQLATWAEEVRALAAEVPAGVADRIAADVKALHPSKVNAELADAGLADECPPSSHIDMRRMAVAALRLQAFRDAGVVPGTDQDEPTEGA